MINWDLIDSLLSKSRGVNRYPYRVAIYSRMRYVEEQFATAEIHIKHIKILMSSETRFKVTDVFSDFGVANNELSKMKEYKRLIEKCNDGSIDLIVIHDLSRLAYDCVELMTNVEPLASYQPEIGVLAFQDQLFVMAKDAYKWAEKMASRDYSACRLPYFVGLMPPTLNHCEI